MQVENVCQESAITDQLLRECLAKLCGPCQSSILEFPLYGKEFLLETDHQPLIYLNETKLNNS